eukprot:scaffold54253_cov77-Attheya_sp.AAC.4
MSQSAHNITAKSNPTSPTKASKPTKIPSPRWKKDGFSKINKIERVAKQNQCEIKEDLDRARPIQEDLNLVAGYPRCESRENQEDTYEERPSLDEYMMDTDIIEYMLNHLEMPDTDNAHWARENIHMVHYYFNGPTFPRLAVATFGFPS